MTATEPVTDASPVSVAPFTWLHLPDCRTQVTAWQRAAAARLLGTLLLGGDLKWRIDPAPAADATAAPTWIELRDGTLGLAVAVQFDAWADFSSPDQHHYPPAAQPLLWACRHHRLLEALRAAGGRQWQAVTAVPAPARGLALPWRLDSSEGSVAGGQLLLPAAPIAAFAALSPPPPAGKRALSAHVRWLLALPGVCPHALQVGAICLLPADATGALAVGGQRLPLQLDRAADKATVDVPGTWIDYMTQDKPNHPQSGPLQLEVAVVLQRQRVRVDTLQALQPGAVLDLPRLAEDAAVTLEVEGQWLADGRIVRIGDHLGVQIISLRADGP